MFERMLIGRIENRVLVGVLSFVVLMVVLGWAAINEGGRMVAFTAEEHARSVENGADTFASACTICHGADGRGNTGRAPGLNNPQLFGHDFFPDITKQEADMAKQAGLLTKEETDLKAKLADATTSQADKDAATARIADIDKQLSQFTQTAATLDAQRVAALQPAVMKGYNPAKFDRLKMLNWGGTLDSFIVATLIQGRPVSESYWPQQMPTWGDLAGGPYRMDQLEDLAAYIENWDKGNNWTQDDLFAVNQFAIEPVDGAPLKAQIAQLEQNGGTLPEAVGTDVNAILAKLPQFTGNADHGNDLYHGKAPTQLGTPVLPCSTCHTQTSDGTGPEANGTYTRIQNVRLKDPKLAGYTPEQFIVESITHPDAYVAPGFNNVMPQVFGSELSYQDLADIIAYLKTLT